LTLWHNEFLTPLTKVSKKIRVTLGLCREAERGPRRCALARVRKRAK
jgi:hypothetical protein